jgi:predicted lipoprotein with Yx(FWY)xxD motif
MTHLHKARVRPLRSVLVGLALTAGVGAGLLAGIALAKSFTLGVVKNAKVTNANTMVSKRQTIVVTAKGLPVYWLSGETTHHAECKTAKCFKFWPPVKVASGAKLSAAPGISGKLGVWHRKGFTQLTLGGHPLYTFAFDKKGQRHATGQAIKSFGGTWSVIKAKAGAGSGGSTSSSTSSTGPTWG